MESYERHIAALVRADLNCDVPVYAPAALDLDSADTDVLHDGLVDWQWFLRSQHFVLQRFPALPISWGSMSDTASMFLCDANSREAPPLRGSPSWTISST